MKLASYIVIALAVTVVALLAWRLPECKPVTLGGVVLLAGCAK